VSSVRSVPVRTDNESNTRWASLSCQHARNGSTMEKYLPRAEAAEYLGVTPRWFTRPAGRQIPFSRIGGKNLWAVSDLDAYVTSRRRVNADFIGGAE
jgi:hypothetical protein